MSTSPYRRPEQPASGFILQPRDRKILKTVVTHRFVRSDHVRDLLFPDKCLRVVQVRLRKLWEHRYLARYFVPKIWNVPEPAMVRPGQPVYGLDEAGVALFADSENAHAIVAKYRAGKVSSSCLEHNLVATDFLVSTALACSGRKDLQLVEAESEASFWHKITEWKAKGNRGQFIIPDCGVTLANEKGERLTFYVEVVRADVKGGNGHLIRKLDHYVKLLREGFFKKVYGHDHLRAVIIATTSGNRADNLRELAKSLTNGRRLFWFGSFQTKGEDGSNISTITRDTILAKKWMTADGELLSIAEAV
ncbi:MAG: replication-relaxation family protein [Patescibacteria group bacterium]